jgi:dihydrofolate reductase
MNPLISIIVATGTKGQLGLNGSIPWDNKKDLERFKYLTLRKPVIMGRKTYESIGKPLVGRQNIIITSDKNYFAPMCNVSSDVRNAIVALSQSGNRFNNEIIIIGGESIYSQVMDLVDIIYLTHVPYNGPADTWMPAITGSWNRVYHETDADGSLFEILWRNKA